MKTKYTSVQLYATQGGGTAIREGNQYYFHDIPDWSDYQPGDPVPDEWGVHAIHKLYQLSPKPIKKIESRNQREGTPAEHRNYWNRKYKVFRIQKKRAKLALKGTMRSVSAVRIKSIMHMIGINMARDERKVARKVGEPIHFYEGDLLRVVNVDDYSDILRLNDICTMEQSSGRDRPNIVVFIHRTSELKVVKKSSFVLHKRYIENE